MKISTKGRYGIRFMMDLALHRNEGNVSLKNISQRQDISEKYLWQVITPLKKQGLIQSFSGPGGGYRLNRKPEDITLHDMLSALEDDSLVPPCVNEPPRCPRSNVCAAREMWAEVDKRIASVLSSISLQDFAAKQSDMSNKESLNYAI